MFLLGQSNLESILVHLLKAIMSSKLKSLHLDFFLRSLGEGWVICDKHTRTYVQAIYIYRARPYDRLNFSSLPLLAWVHDLIPRLSFYWKFLDSRITD